MSSIIRLVAALGVLAMIDSTAAAGPPPVVLGSAGNFAVLAKTGVSSVPNSAVNGNLGVSPASTASITGFSLVEDSSGTFSTSSQVTGHVFGASDAPPTPAVLTTAVVDMQTAYTDAMGRSGPNFIGLNAGNIGGLVLIPGLYKWTTGVSITLDITLTGSAADTWIFQISGGLTQAANTNIILLGGALSQNIVWVVAGVVSVGVGATFEGNILAQTNVVLQTGAIDHGCIYAQTNVALQKATVLCSSGPPPTSTSSVPPSTTPTPPPTSTPPTSTPPTSTPPTSTPPTSTPPTSTPKPPPTSTSTPCTTSTTFTSTYKPTSTSTPCTTSTSTHKSTSTSKSTSTYKPTSTSTPCTTSTAKPTSTSHCKPYPSGLPCYKPVFEGQTSTVHGSDYITSVLVDTVDACLQTCMCETGCGFVNTYYDLNVKNKSTKLTCALYRGCHTAKDCYTSFGDSKVSSINGYCLCSA